MHKIFIRLRQLKNQANSVNGLDQQSQQNSPQQPVPPNLSEDLDANLGRLKEVFAVNMDAVIREIRIGGSDGLRAALVYFQGLVDTELLDRDVLQPLMFKIDAAVVRETTSAVLTNLLVRQGPTVGQVEIETNYARLLRAVYAGKVGVLVDRVDTALVIDIRGGKVRAIEEPYMEKTLRGSREGFVEQLQTNIAMVRRKLGDQNLLIERALFGERTQSDTAILYIKDIADPKIVKELKMRLARIKIDGTLATGTLEQLIEDNPYSVFPQTRTTERPDRTAAALLEGKIAIIMDGTPFVIILPVVFIGFLQGSEDYFERTYAGSFMRLVRFLALLITLVMPGAYIALTSFNHELLPYQVLLTLAAARQNVPWPPIVAMLLMELTIELLREGGLRLPTQLGQTLGIVGGIVLGQAAISSELIAPQLLMVVAVTTLSSFAIPNYSMGIAIRLIRFPMMIISGIFGILGLALGVAVLLVHLAKLESFGVPYLSPLAPIRFADWKDVFYRTFIWKMRHRPLAIPSNNSLRQQNPRRRDGRDAN